MHGIATCVRATIFALATALRSARGRGCAVLRFRSFGSGCGVLHARVTHPQPAL